MDQAHGRDVDGHFANDGKQNVLFEYTDAMIKIAGQSWCMGCTYQVSAAEFSEPSHVIHSAATEVKKIRWGNCENAPSPKVSRMPMQ
jgi:hypothetical protein